MKYIAIVSPISNMTLHHDLDCAAMNPFLTEVLFFYPDIKGFIEYAAQSNARYMERLKKIGEKEGVNYQDVHGLTNKIYAKSVLRQSNYLSGESSFAQRAGAIETVGVMVVLTDGFEDSPPLTCVQITGNDLSRLSGSMEYPPFMHPGHFVGAPNAPWNLGGQHSAQPGVFPQQGFQYAPPMHPQPYPTPRASRVPTPPNATGVDPQSPYSTTGTNQPPLYQNPFPVDGSALTGSIYNGENSTGSTSMSGTTGNEPATGTKKEPKPEK